MIRCKLEYMIKHIDIKKRKRLVFLFDKDSCFEFHKVNIDRLEKFKNMEPKYGDDVEAILYEVAIDMDKELRNKYKEIFTEINQICVECNTYPIFEDPSNIEDCLVLRKEILKEYDEEVTNKFFNTNSLRDYEPPYLRDVYYYPAVFTKEEDGKYSVTIPDIFGGVTCGDNYNDAFKMAEDMVKMMLTKTPGQCFPPKTLEETKKNFPNNIVVLVKVEIEKK